MSEKTPVADRIADLEEQLLAAKFEQQGRPADVNGVIEDVNGNRPYLTKDADQYFEGQRKKYEQESMPKSYDQMSITQVAKALANAEFVGDKTKVEDLNDVLADKLAAEEDKINSERDNEHNSERSDNLWNRVMSVKDSELARLEGKVGESQSAEAEAVEKDAAVAEAQEAVIAAASDSREAVRTRVRESVDKGDIVRFRNKDGKLEEWEVRTFGKPDKYGDTPVLLRKTDGSGDEHVRFVDGLLDAIEEGPVEAPKKDKSLHEELKSIPDLEREDGNVEMELHQTTDPAEARKYWEKYVKNSGVTLEAFMAQGVEGSWLIKRPKQQEQPKNPEVPQVEDDPEKVDEVPTPDHVDDGGSDEPTPTEPIPVVPAGSPVWTPRGPEGRGPRPNRLRRRIGAWALAVATLLSGYTAGRVNENILIKRHDTPSVDTINKAEDHLRKLPEAQQEHIVRNFDLAEDFFSKIGTEKGKSQFKDLQDAVDKETAKFKEKFGNSITERRARELAEAKVGAQLKALELAQLEAKAAK